MPITRKRVELDGRLYLLEGDAYQVADRHADGESDPSWWEYEVCISDAETGAAIYDWDSFHETYNGCIPQRLTLEGAANALHDWLAEADDGLLADVIGVERKPDA